jgi:hypothetical protein
LKYPRNRKSLNAFLNIQERYLFASGNLGVRGLKARGLQTHHHGQEKGASFCQVLLSLRIYNRTLNKSIVFYPDFALNSNAGLVGLIAASNDTTNTDKSMRFKNANGTGPWQVIASSGINADDWGNPGTTYYVNGSAVADGASLVNGWNILGAYRTNQTTFSASFTYFLGTEGYSAAVRDFQGRIAMCLLYNRQLSAAEHAKNYNALKRRFGLT